MRGRRAWLTAGARGCGLVLLGTAVPADAAWYAPPVSTKFEGRYRYVGGKKQREGVHEAIERAVEAMPRILQAMARGRLRGTNPVPANVRIVVGAADTTIHYGDFNPQKARFDGTAARWKNPEGNHVHLRIQAKGNKLVHTVWGSGGKRVNTWKLNDDGTKLRMRSVISSRHLPVSVDYRLTFKRK